MKRIGMFTIILTIIVYSTCLSDPNLKDRTLVKLENMNSMVVVDLGGGSIVDFHLKEHELNPLTWNYPDEGDTDPRSMGHFICLDRWGAASKAETAKGMPWHGEASKVNWQILQAPVSKNGEVYSEMLCELPVAGLTLKRSLILDEKEAVLTVTETITNVNKLGRIFNVVQHATFGPPFLDESVVFDTKVKKGFAQGGEMPNPEEPVFYWPKAVFRGSLVDFRSLSADNADPGVISFILNNDDEYGWATACNASKGLMIGYIWKTAEYPWLNMWRNLSNGRPAAFAFEFGTTGLHQPYSVLVEKEKIFDHKLYEYIDADETIVKSYTAFLARIPENYKGVNDIQFKDGTIVLKEQGGDVSRDIVVTLNKN